MARCLQSPETEVHYETRYPTRVLLLQTGSVLLQGWRLLLLQQEIVPTAPPLVAAGGASSLLTPPPGVSFDSEDPGQVSAGSS